MKPTLPQDDPAVALRREALDRARKQYVYDRSVRDCLFAATVPVRDKGSPGAANELCSTYDHDGDGYSGDVGD